CRLCESMLRHRSKMLDFCPPSSLFWDTEFPGVVVRPIGEFRSTVDYQYQLLRDGDYPPGTTTWQFNFKFNLTTNQKCLVLQLLPNFLGKDCYY
uniref:Uncharacterized protein n=1 Tax=Oryzias melastigma TaxID=30732 RepID=A0A3B3E1D6_ORYME